MTKFTFSMIGLAGLVGVFMVAPSAHATVGGPTYVSRISFSPQEQAVYYLVSSESGRGCPPIIRKIDLVRRTQTDVVSCDDLMSGAFGENYYDSTPESPYGQFIESTFADLIDFPAGGITSYEPLPSPEPQPSPESPFSYYQILMIILALLIGTGVGYMLGKSKS